MTRGIVQVLVAHAKGAREGERMCHVGDLLSRMAVRSEREPNTRLGGAADDARVGAVAVRYLERDPRVAQRTYEPFLVRFAPESGS